jgi:1,2-dihydroxy-3-keto-5-methylthiopentene dioxygenase
VDADNFETDEKLAHIRKSRGYKNHDFVLSTNIPNLEAKLETFKTEHIHYDEEIRLLLDGSGYFDLKDANDEWIRVETPKVSESTICRDV